MAVNQENAFSTDNTSAGVYTGEPMATSKPRKNRREPTYVRGPLLARGGMAEIFLGKAIPEDGYERVCAIKRILPHYAQEAEFLSMFRDEAAICKQLQHTNIVQVYEKS